MNPFLLSSTFLYGAGLYLFYIRYVPLVKSFQTALIPILFLVFILTAFKLRWGVLFFVFSFPLINNLPYFFGIHEPLPHAPSALVLFLFFFLGWLVHRVFSQESLDFKHPVFRPLILFAIIVFGSGLITFWKYANFFPFLSDYVYELIVNAIGGSAGGAIMSTVFFSLNYLTGMAFFVVLFIAVRSGEFVKKIVVVLGLSTFISLAFGLYQRFGDMKFGNNPISINQGLINATFKDALSFGVYLAVVTPLVLGGMFCFKKAVRIFPIVVAVLALYMIFFTGSKSGLMCLLLSLLIFFALSIKRGFELMRTGSTGLKKATGSLLIAVLAVSAAFFAFVVWKKDIASSITISRLGSTLKLENVRLTLTGRVDGLWKLAGIMIKDYPLSGVGAGGYIIESANYAQKHKVNLEVPESAENYLLQVGAELGVIGVLLVLWVFWEISRQMRRSYRKRPADDTNAYLLIGAIAGVIAFFVNIQAHTYIGSYEIKYTFWLLVGLIFSLGRIAESENKEKGLEEPDSPKQKIRWSGSFKVFSLVLILLYSCVHLWNSTHSLSLKSRTELLEIKQDFGFYQHEKTNDGREFRWTREYGGLTVKIEKPVIEIPLLASHPDIQRNPVKVKIYLIKDFFKQKKLLDELILNQSIWKTCEYEVPEELGEELILLVKVSRTWNPQKALGTPDPRNLGVALGKIEFKDKMDP
ncbi:MAG TPA: O-antigen ligase family protein [Candidatus Desulfaltia sp.]|nr:O-antigen ligase family protein [Candidatus Desulfaltia sp.]